MSGVRDQGWGLGMGFSESREQRHVRDRGWGVWGQGGTGNGDCKWGWGVLAYWGESGMFDRKSF
jgi:hypothetical protein